MSAVEFALTPQPPFLGKLSSQLFEQPPTTPEVLAARYAGLSDLSRSAMSMSPEVLSRSLVALLRPLLAIDFANIVFFNGSDNESDDGITWSSFGTEQLSSPDGAIEESTLWSVYQEQKPLWIADWVQSDRLAVRNEAQKAALQKTGVRLLKVEPAGK